jgi:WD40 repeat protein
MRSISVCILGAFIASCATLAQDIASPAGAKKKDADEKTIRTLIAQLGDESFEKREAADKALADIGRPAMPLLRKAAADATDLEVRDRAERLLRKFSAEPGPGLVLAGGTVREIAISKDGQILGFACSDKTVCVYNVKTMALRRTLHGHDRGVWSVAISPDGKTLASGAGEMEAKGAGDIILWDLVKGVALRTLKGHEGSALSLAFSPDGTRLYSGGFEGTVRAWDPASGKEMGVLVGHNGFVRRVLCTPDGKFIVSGGLDNTLRFWNCATLKEERQIALKRHEGLGAATISPDGKWLITSSRPSVAPDPGVITVWDIATGNEKTTIIGHTRKVGALAVSPDNKQLAMGGGWMGTFGEVKIFDLPTGKELASFQDHKTWVGGLAFTPDGRWLASGAGNAGNGTEMRIWDMKTLSAKGE